MKKWFEQKEQQAGAGRLILTWKIYKIFGEIPVRIIAFFIAFFAYMGGKEQRESSKKYFQILADFTNEKKYKPSFLNSFRHFHSYADSLVDKMLSFSGNLSAKKFEFSNPDDMNLMFETFKEGKGAFFITSHTGNVEIMRSLFLSDRYSVKPYVNVFLQKNSCEIFNTFLEHIKVKTNVDVFPVEEISVDTAVVIKEKLNKGEIVFMAGDRLSAQYPELSYDTEFLNRKVKFPLGALKFAQILECPIFFVVCAKKDGKFIIHLKKFHESAGVNKSRSAEGNLTREAEANQSLSVDVNQTRATEDNQAQAAEAALQETSKISHRHGKREVFDKLKSDYLEFLEEFTIQYPYQFYNFYDMFTD